MLLHKIQVFAAACCLPFALLSGTAAAQEAGACAATIEVVDLAGAAVPAHVELLAEGGPVVATPMEGGYCLRIDGDRASGPILATAEGYQAHATEPFDFVRGGGRRIIVTLYRPFGETMTVEGRASSLVGVSASASEGAVGRSELSARPLTKAGDLLEVVPGVAMTQHSSGGHAPIILLRGYNLDHGTDFAAFLEQMPLNAPSHAHGQGYIDLNFLIPELVERVDFQKGPYSARVGNFGTAGSTNFELVDSIAAPFARVEGGGFGFVRLAAGTSVERHGHRLLLGAEASQDNGPNVVPDDYGRYKAFARYSSGTADRHSSLTVSSYAADWTASDGYPRRALERGYMSRFGTLDPTNGGRSQQHFVVASRRVASGSSLLNAGAYVRYYDMDLFSNLTFWTVSAVDGDQIQQSDRRISSGAHVSYARALQSAIGHVELTAGLQARHDRTRVGLRNTVGRDPRDKFDDEGRLRPALVFDTRIGETTISPFVDARLQLTPWMRIVAGARADALRMDVRAGHAANSGVRQAAIVSPKASVVFGPWRKTEIYTNAGLGFHSNHAAGVMQRVDPVTGAATRYDGSAVEGTPPIVRTRGAEVGVRMQPARQTQVSLALWYLGSDSELLYTPEDGVTSPERPGRRFGLEWLNYVRLRPWLAIDLDSAWSSARYRIDPEGIGRAITDTARAVITAGVSVTRPKLAASLRSRYVGRRPLVPDESIFLQSSLVMNAQAEYQVAPRIRIVFQGFNLFDRRYEDEAYYFSTRIRDPRSPAAIEDAPVADYVSRPGLPRTFRVGVRVGM
ncbi:MAG: TonB-dependent receptor [Vicinamibacterales bacterium]